MKAVVRLYVVLLPLEIEAITQVARPSLTKEREGRLQRQCERISLGRHATQCPPLGQTIAAAARLSFRRRNLRPPRPREILEEAWLVELEAIKLQNGLHHP